MTIGCEKINKTLLQECLWTQRDCESIFVFLDLLQEPE